jgi:glycosyltransferase involved in cell wall biosynthesis
VTASSDISPSRPIRVIAMMEAQWVTGPAKNLIAFAAALRSLPAFDRQVDLSVVVFDRPSSPATRFLSALRAASIPVHVIRERGPGDLRVLAQVRALIASARPDILQTHNSKSHFLLRAAGFSRSVHWIAFHHGFTARNARDRFYNCIGRWALRGAPRVVTVCRAFAADLARAGVPAPRISVHHNMVEPYAPPCQAEQAALRTRFDIPTAARVLLAAGRLSAEKGHADLLDAFALLPTPVGSASRLIIVGDGPERSALERRSAQLGLSGRVIFTGHQESVAPFYALANMFVLPSHSEGSPNVLLEAMSAGLPIITTNAGGAAELVLDGQSALVVPCRNPRAFSDAVARILEEPALAARLGAAAQLASKNYSPKDYAAALIAIYREVLAGP